MKIRVAGDGRRAASPAQARYAAAGRAPMTDAPADASAVDDGRMEQAA
ncbi:hypothetical protein [Solilutibacter pythonis]|nr:hypothetical protein [Lysobacter pythonis]